MLKIDRCCIKRPFCVYAVMPEQQFPHYPSSITIIILLLPNKEFRVVLWAGILFRAIMHRMLFISSMIIAPFMITQNTKVFITHLFVAN